MKLNQPQETAIEGLILSGGQGRRAGGQDKGWLNWQGRTLIEIQAEWMRSQNIEYAISANRNLELYSALGVPVYTDNYKDFQGPLCGIEAGLTKANKDWLWVVPVDLPGLPSNLLALTLDSLSGSAPLYYLASQEREHYLCQLVHRSLLSPLRQFLASGERRVRDFIQQVGGQRLELQLSDSFFTNLNQLAQYKGN